MDLRSLFLGLAVGVLVGWLVFSNGADSASESGAPLVDTAGASGPRLAGREDARETSGDESEEHPLRWPSQRFWDTVRRNRANRAYAGPPHTENVQALVERLSEARRTRDWRLYEAALATLGGLNCAEADEVLIRVLRDREVTFRDRLGARFLTWLAGSNAPGVADAARERFRLRRASGGTSWSGSEGYLDLIAAHASVEDVAWLLESEETKPWRDDAAMALARSPREVAWARIREILLLPNEARFRGVGVFDFPRTLETFIGAHPEEGHAVLADLLRRTLAGENVTTNMSLSDVMRRYGASVPEAALGEARALLLGLDDPMQQIAAVDAVQELSRREFDTTGLDGVLYAPHRALDALDPRLTDSGTLINVAYKALYAIRYNRITWTEEAARSLEAAADRCGTGHSVFGDMRQTAAKIRAWLKAPWKD